MVAPVRVGLGSAARYGTHCPGPRGPMGVAVTRRLESSARDYAIALVAVGRLHGFSDALKRIDLRRIVLDNSKNNNQD